MSHLETCWDIQLELPLGLELAHELGHLVLHNAIFTKGDGSSDDPLKMGVWSYDFVEAQTHDGLQDPAHDVDRRVYSLSPFAMGTFYGNRTAREGAQRVLIEPSLDDPCTALCVIDRAPKPRAADGKLSEVS